ncbi:MAG: RnfABCDGE type electron transport complex subunit B [Firmicutes bacterium]|nr:RnfABCDGE type electron transport complex subunit B [Bacillota bacterium]
MAVVPAVLVLGLTGAVFGVVLAVAARKFHVEQDPRQDEICGLLPGANCGACGFPGCSGLAASIVAGDAPCNACPVSGNEVASKIASIMGVELTSQTEKKVARVLCQGSDDKCGLRYVYDGLQQCKAQTAIAGGAKSCVYGCLGLGSCVDVCKFDAIHMGPLGLPVVDETKCTSCGMCVEACPRGTIQLMPMSQQVTVLCRSKGRGAEVRKTCKIGCIGCGICQKACPKGAITLEDNLAVINCEECDACGICVEKCPTKCIVMKDKPVIVDEAASAS